VIYKTTLIDAFSLSDLMFRSEAITLTISMTSASRKKTDGCNLMSKTATIVNAKKRAVPERNKLKYGNPDTT